MISSRQTNRRGGKISILLLLLWHKQEYRSCSLADICILSPSPFPLLSYFIQSLSDGKINPLILSSREVSCPRGNLQGFPWTLWMSRVREIQICSHISVKTYKQRGFSLEEKQNPESFRFGQILFGEEYWTRSLLTSHSAVLAFSVAWDDLITPGMSANHQPWGVAATGKSPGPCPPELGRSLRMGCSASPCLYTCPTWTTLEMARRFFNQLSHRDVPGNVPFSCFFSWFAHSKR